MKRSWFIYATSIVSCVLTALTIASVDAKDDTSGSKKKESAKTEEVKNPYEGKKLDCNGWDKKMADFATRAEKEMDKITPPYWKSLTLLSDQEEKFEEKIMAEVSNIDPDAVEKYVQDVKKSSESSVIIDFVFYTSEYNKQCGE